MIELTLPLPPSTNNLYITRGRKRVISPGYRAWIEAAGWALVEQKPKPVKGDYDLWLYCDWVQGGKNRGDLDNRVKAVSDLLVKHQLVSDDSVMEALHVYRRLKGRECVVRVCERKPA